MMMTESTFWLIAAAVLVGAEMFSGTLYLLAIAIGMLVGALLAWLGFDLTYQLLAASASSLLTVWLLKQWKRRHISNINPTNLLDVGQRVEVDSWRDERHARVRYRGTLWDGELARNATPRETSYFIIAQRGNVLILDNQTN
ncbi:hypothetical protein IGB42_01166 [Andreprevotia sp. IGB-42]|uniref:NfeD family protein n=1 Tax=Andreprevotia sp. IGB-42 TaxID=2497473 RepID=UPI00135A5917|nr:NfeD family protein [Andreprevotia sp. IGB-42]KAF0814267.1 hypothetical protein IGB42_01166 [Andreprevotia sp. IGB-42]